jgi:hypothetical protein
MIFDCTIDLTIHVFASIHLPMCVCLSIRSTELTSPATTLVINEPALMMAA